MGVDVDPDWDEPRGSVVSTASHHGAERFGLAGTVSRGTAAEAAGLATLSGSEFSDGPTTPMLPSSWR